MRNPYFDFLRGVAIIMVVAIHTFTLPTDIGSGIDYSNAIRQVLNSAVPLFLALSGYFGGMKVLAQKEQVTKYWKKQIPRVYIPCFIWSIPYFVIGIANGKNILISGIRLFTCGYSIYYFILLIIQCYLLLPLIHKYNSLKTVFVSLLITLASLLVINYSGVKLPLFVYASPVVTWIVYFVLGVYLSKQRQYSFALSFILMSIGYFLSIVESTIFQKYGIKTSSMIFSIGVILVLFHGKKIHLYDKHLRRYDIIYKLGPISFGIYLIHRYIEGWDTIYTCFPTSWFARMLVVLMISVLIIIVTTRLLPQKIIRLLGFN